MKEDEIIAMVLAHWRGKHRAEIAGRSERDLRIDARAVARSARLEVSRLMRFGLDPYGAWSDVRSVHVLAPPRLAPA